MKTNIDSKSIRKGATIIYNDGRGDAAAIVLSVKPNSMLVQFADRADTTTIRFNDAAWMNYLTLKP